MKGKLDRRHGNLEPPGTLPNTGGLWACWAATGGLMIDQLTQSNPRNQPRAGSILSDLHRHATTTKEQQHQPWVPGIEYFWPLVPYPQTSTKHPHPSYAGLRGPTNFGLVINGGFLPCCLGTSWIFPTRIPSLDFFLLLPFPCGLTQNHLPGAHIETQQDQLISH